MRIIQITDTHIYSDDNKFGLKHLSNLKYIVDFIESNDEQINADLIMVTGDISHDGGEASYERFFKTMCDVSLPFYVIPGNHDNKQVLHYVSDKYDCGLNVNSFGDKDWRILSVDSVVDNEDYGFIKNKELVDFEKEVLASRSKKIAVFLHHHPIQVGTPIVDNCMLKNASEFLDICQRLNVSFIGSGHAHTLFQRKIGDTLVSVSPAACSQWKNGTKEVCFIENSAFSVVNLGEHVHVAPWFI
ncbi:TPA: metallophosphoesterase [Serratia marcescens]|uniref:metallophosphoesterase family protein n=1 Tax=Serratia marcescens TaxID=615 RepID=UPI00097152F2|nr:metallophosphoesterase [Serratia marcescens]AQT55474.1 hypothetical protein AR325_27045 [Serratia marcescens]HCU0429643.1 metallophosphoesterase [Serratia marcescens]